MKNKIQKFLYFFGCLSLSMIFVYALGAYMKSGILDGLWLSESSFKSIDSFLFEFGLFTFGSLSFVYLDAQRTKAKSVKNKPSKLRECIVMFLTYFGLLSLLLIFINSLIGYLIIGNLYGIAGSLKDFFIINTFLVNLIIILLLAILGTAIEIWRKKTKY